MKAIKVFGKEKNVIAIILLLSLIVLGGLQVISYGVHEKAFMGDETYYYMRLSEQYQEERVFDYDFLQERPVSFNLLYLVPGTNSVPVESTARILPVLGGVLSIFLFHYLARTLKFRKDERLIATIIFAANPLFVYTFTSFTPLIIGVPLGLAGMALFFRKKTWVSGIMLGVLPLLSVPLSLVVLLSVILAMIIGSARKNQGIMVILSAVLVGAASWLFLGFRPWLELIPSPSAMAGVFVELAGVQAYSFIILALAIIGLLSLWERNTKSVAVLLFLFLSFVFSLFYAESRIIVSMALAVYAGIAIISIIQREWNVEAIKNITLLLILCSVVFSFVVAIDNAFSDVSTEKIQGIQYLSTSDPGEVMLSAERNGFMMSYFSGRKSFVDGISHRYEEYDERINVAETIYYSRNLESLESTLKDNGISYVLVDNRMRQGEVWTGDNEGVLFLFRHANAFVKIFENAEVVVYRHMS